MTFDMFAVYGKDTQSGQILGITTNYNQSPDKPVSIFQEALGVETRGIN